MYEDIYEWMCLHWVCVCARVCVCEGEPLIRVLLLFNGLGRKRIVALRHLCFAVISTCVSVCVLAYVCMYVCARVCAFFFCVCGASVCIRDSCLFVYVRN